MSESLYEHFKILCGRWNLDIVLSPKPRISQLTNLCKCQQVLDSQAHGAFDIDTPTVPRPNSLSHPHLNPRLAEFTELSYFLSVWLLRKCKKRKENLNHHVTCCFVSFKLHAAMFGLCIFRFHLKNLDGVHINTQQRTYVNANSIKF